MLLLFFSTLFWSFVYFLIPVHLADVGLTGYEIGVLTALYVGMSLVVSFPTGFINDRWTVKATLVLGIIMFTTFLLGISLVTSFLLFIPLFVIGGLGIHIEEASIRTITYKTKMKRKEGEKLGFYRLVHLTGSSLGLLIGGAIIFLFDFSLGLAIMGIIYLLSLALTSFKTHMHHTIRLIDYGHDIMSKGILPVVAVLFLYSLHWGAEATSYGLFLANNLGLDIFMSAMYIAFSLPALGAVCYFFGMRVDRKKTDVRHLLVGGFVISGIGLVLHTIPIAWISFLFRVVHEVGDGMTMIAFFIWVSRIFGKKRIGGDTGIMFTIMLVGQMIGSLIYGPLGFEMGYHFPSIISGVTNIVSAVLLVTFMRFIKLRLK